MFVTIFAQDKVFKINIYNIFSMTHLLLPQDAKQLHHLTVSMRVKVITMVTRGQTKTDVTHVLAVTMVPTVGHKPTKDVHSQVLLCPPSPNTGETYCFTDPIGVGVRIGFRALSSEPDGF